MHCIDDALRGRLITMRYTVVWIVAVIKVGDVTARFMRLKKLVTGRKCGVLISSQLGRCERTLDSGTEVDRC